MQLIVTEKPSVARDLARVLGLPVRGSGDAFEGEGCAITWCVGHLVELAEPADYDARWKTWRLDALPMLPAEFRLRPSRSAAARYQAVARLLRQRRFTELVNACDAGREGELIFRYLVQLAGCRLPVRRLWISSLTDEAVRAGMAALRPGQAFDALADAARCRSEADWLVGLNATRALTVRRRAGADSPLLSIGRVQTPTLAMLVERERAIHEFVPHDYFEVRARFGATPAERFDALWSSAGASRLSARALAEAVVARDGARGAAAHAEGPVVESLRARRVREPPPLLFDLTALQRTSNRRFGLSAARTLSVAQSLYEKHKLLTYPRTDSRHLTSDVERELPSVLRGLAGFADYAALVAPLAPRPPALGRRFVDDARVGDHHAIIPTGKRADTGRLDLDERRIHDMVVRRFLGAFYPDAEFDVTDVVVRVGPGDGAPAATPGPDETRRPHVAVTAATAPGGAARPAASSDEAPRLVDVLPPLPDRYHARGRVRVVVGWQEVAGIEPQRRAGPRDPDGERGDDAAGAEVATLPRLTQGQRLDGSFAVRARTTTPPPRHTEATLLGAMESAGKSVEDEALRQAMKDTGLGTPATRAAIIETLIERTYVERSGRTLAPTATGVGLIVTLPVPSLASPELTGAWEARLCRIARGEEQRERFMEDIRRYVSDIVSAIVSSPAGASPAGAWSMTGAMSPSGAAPAGTSLNNPRRPQASASPVQREPKPRVGPGAARAVRERARPGATGDARRGRNARPARTPDARPVAPIGRRGNAPPRGVGPAHAPRSSRTPPGARPGAGRADAPPPDIAARLPCPRCREGILVRGRRGWGCSRWRTGCGFVVWFETAGKQLTPRMLADLVTHGKTRRMRFHPSGAAPVEGRLVLDVNGPAAARLIPTDR